MADLSIPISLRIPGLSDLITSFFKKNRKRKTNCIETREILKLDELIERIGSTQREYFVIGISGGYTLKQSANTLGRWLIEDKSRQAYIMLLNPKSLVIDQIGFGGTRNLELEINECLEYIVSAARDFPSIRDQLHVKFYDVAPIHSGFAFDCNILGTESTDENAAVFIEGYGYDTEWHDRPCYQIEQKIQPHFNVYRRSFQAIWKKSGTELDFTKLFSSPAASY